MSARSRKKKAPPKDEKAPLPGMSRKTGYLVMAVMVAVLLSVIAMFGLGIYLLNETAKSKGVPANTPAPAVQNDVEKK
jgi:flagellar basal body-associated protein FliL